MNRRKAREQAFILIFERSISHDTTRQIVDAAETSEDIRIEEFAEQTAEGVEQNELVLDGQIQKYLRGWKMDRLSKVVLSLLRLSLYEMNFGKDIPVSVSINEAVNLAKKYGDEKDARFINGVLGSAAREHDGEDA
jgi:N utilization substance protein B